MKTKNCSVVIKDDSILFKEVPIFSLFVSLSENLMIKLNDTQAVRLSDSQLMKFDKQLDRLTGVEFNRLSEPVFLAKYRE